MHVCPANRLPCLWSVVTLLALACKPIALASETQPPPRSLDRWTYIQVDDNRSKWGDWDQPAGLKYFGLDMRDVNGDGYLDIVSGRYFYRNPGGDMTGRWTRVDLGRNVDGMLFVDVDDDRYGDIIAEALPDVFWLEANDVEGTSWTCTKIAELPPTKHVNGQGYRIAQVEAGGKPEILLTSGDGLYMISIPAAPAGTPWPARRIAPGTSEEGIGVADFDRDGDLDLAAGSGAQHGEARTVAWWENPGHLQGDWQQHIVGDTISFADRIEAADFDGDGDADIAVAEEGSRASIHWFECPADPMAGRWKRHTLATQATTNNLDVADMDRDGDFDIVAAEHRGQKRVQVWENLGEGKEWQEHVISQGKESHLGAQVADMDCDGDFDVVSIAWDDYTQLHLWRNDHVRQLQKPGVQWKHLSSAQGDLPMPAQSSGQPASLILDVNQDGRDDFFIAGWDSQEDLVWYRSDEQGWTKLVVDQLDDHIEAGGAFHDIDADGDFDVVFGETRQGNQLWWWENPHPNFDRLWTRHPIKDWGGNQYHDQIFGDFDGDGQVELVAWNQRAGQLLLFEVPEDPRASKRWPAAAIYRWSDRAKMEGLAAADIDLDGKTDIVGAGRWFNHVEGQTYQEHIVDADMKFTRAGAGQLKRGGRPEIVFTPGDANGVTKWYEWTGHQWIPHELESHAIHTHTLDVRDINKDGYLDIFVGEMGRWGNASTPQNPAARIWIYYGDGTGVFEKTLAHRGQGVHEGRIGDLDGDRDLDILVKPFQHNFPRVDVLLNIGSPKPDSQSE